MEKTSATSTGYSPLETHNHSTTKPTLLRRREVERRTGSSCSRIYALMSHNDFPKPIRLGPKSVAWIDIEIDGWIESRIAGSRI